MARRADGDKRPCDRRSRPGVSGEMGGSDSGRSPQSNSSPHASVGSSTASSGSAAADAQRSFTSWNAFGSGTANLSEQETAISFRASRREKHREAYRKAFGRANSFIYLEDQYFWSEEVTESLVEALHRCPGLLLIVVVPRYPERGGVVASAPEFTGQRRAIEQVRGGGGDRVAIYDLENEAETPIYVHAKVCIVDDVWAAIGSDNLNRRSWTHDSELSCSVIDELPDDRDPLDPAGRGEGARRFARELRLMLWREHLGRESDGGLIDPKDGFEFWEDTAAALESWVGGGRRGPRPPGRVRKHEAWRVSSWARWWADPAYRWLVDPDGRPADMRGRADF